jgi:hypothetical protein
MRFGHAEMALSHLDSLGNDLSDAEQQQALTIKTQAYQANQNWLELANSYIRLADFVSYSEQAANQQALWQALMKLSPEALDVFNPGFPPAVDSGWFALAYAIKAYQTNPEAMVVALEDWQRSYPNHPASPDLYKSKLNAGTRLPQQIENIAILLPESGPYAKAAEIIKRGIIAMHFESGSAANLNFFAVDTDRQTRISNVVSQYQQAVSSGADLVIGPLDKIAVQNLANSTELTVPVLALNRISNSAKQLFQFGLAPEDDAIAALVALGYKLNQAQTAVKKVAAKGMSTEAIIKDALKSMM